MGLPWLKIFCTFWVYSSVIQHLYSALCPPPRQKTQTEEQMFLKPRILKWREGASPFGCWEKQWLLQEEGVLIPVCFGREATSPGLGAAKLSPPAWAPKVLHGLNAEWVLNGQVLIWIQFIRGWVGRALSCVSGRQCLSFLHPLRTVTQYRWSRTKWTAPGTDQKGFGTWFCEVTGYTMQICVSLNGNEDLRVREGPGRKGCLSLSRLCCSWAV